MGVPSFMSQLNSIINSLYQQEHIGARYQQIISNVTNERKNNVKKGSSQSSSSSSSTSNNNSNTNNSNTNNSNNSNNSNNKSNETKFQPPFISNRIHSKVFDCIYIDINPLIHGVVRGVQNSIDATNSSTTETSQKDSKKSSSQNKSESSSQNKSESSSQKDSKKSSSSRPQDSKKSSSQNKSTTTDNTCDDKIVRGVIKSLEEVMTNFKAQTHWFISFDGVATKSKRIKQRSNRAKESKKRNGEKKNMSSSDSVDITENHTNNPVDIHTNDPVDIHTNDPVDISENHTNHPMDITENHTNPMDNVPNDEIMLDLADEEMSDDENNDNGTTTTVNMEKDHSVTCSPPPLFEIPKKRSLSVEISPGTNLSKKIYEAVLNLAFHYSKTHNVTVYVSSSCRSGEGETKIIEHLRKYMQTTTSKKSNRSSSNSSSGNNNNGNSSSNNSHNNTRPSTSVLIISHDSDMVLIPLSNPELNCSFNVLVPNGTRCSYGTMIDITGLKLLLYHLFKMNQVTSTMNPQNASMTSSSSIPSSSIMNQISSSIPSSSIMNNNDNNNHQISNHHDNNNNQISSSIPSSSINPQPSLPNSNEIIQQLCLDFVCISLLAGGCDYFNPFAKTLEHRWRRYFKLIQTEKTNYSIFTLKHDEKTNEYILNINTNNLLFVFGNYVRDKRSTIAPNPDNAIQFFKQLTACVLQFKGQLPIMEYFSRKLSMVDLLALIEREKKANNYGTSTQANDHGTSTLSNSTMEEDGSTSIMIQDLNHTMNGTMSGSSSSSTITINGSSSSTSSTITTPLNTIENQSNTTTKTNNTPKKSSINPTFKITTSFQELVDTYHLTPLECLFSMITSHNSHALPHDKLIELFSFSPKLCDLLHIDSKFNYENGNDNHWIASNEPYELIRQGIMEWKEKYPTITDEVINNKHIGTIQFTCVGSGSSSNTVLLKHSGGLVGGAVQNDAKTKSTTTTTTTTTTTMTTTTSKSSSNNNNNNSNHSKDRQNKSPNEKENNQIQVLEETIRPFEACVPYPFVPGIYTLSRLRFANDKIRYQRANTLNQYTLGEEFDRTVLDIPLTSKQVKIVKKKQLPPPPNPLKKKKSMQQQSMATTTCESLSVTESEVNRSGILQALLQKSNKLPESIAVNMDTSNGSENSLKKRKLNQLSTIQQSERKPKTVKLEQASTPAGQGQTTKQTSRRSKKKSSASSNNPSENNVSLPTAEPGSGDKNTKE